MDQYLPLLTLFVLVLLFVVISVVASRLVSPHQPTPAKLAPYECGIIPSRDQPERFPVRFYLVAMIFIIFDIEIVFLYPWATVFRRLGGFGLAEILLFAAAVFVSFVYLLSKGAIDWGPVKRTMERPELTASGRTTETTIRRVGLEGRDVA